MSSLLFEISSFLLFLHPTAVSFSTALIIPLPCSFISFFVASIPIAFQVIHLSVVLHRTYSSYSPCSFLVHPILILPCYSRHITTTFFFELSGLSCQFLSNFTLCPFTLPTSCRPLVYFLICLFPPLFQRIRRALYFQSSLHFVFSLLNRASFGTESANQLPFSSKLLLLSRTVVHSFQ